MRLKLQRAVDDPEQTEGDLQRAPVYVQTFSRRARTIGRRNGEAASPPTHRMHRCAIPSGRRPPLTSYSDRVVGCDAVGGRRGGGRRGYRASVSARQNPVPAMMAPLSLVLVRFP
jgi:hypothetical protein